LVLKKMMNSLRLASKIQDASPFNLSDVRWLALLRHGESEFNLVGRIAGQLCFPYGARLTAKGRKSARKATSQIRLIQDALGIDNVACSSVERAVETLELCTTGLTMPDPIYFDGLRERGMGGAVLLPKAMFGPLFEDPSAKPPTEGAVSDGLPESFEEFVERVHASFRNDIVPLLRQGNTLVVSHQYVTAAIEMLLFDWSIRETMHHGHQIPNSAPLVIGLNRHTLQPVLGGLCVL
jgi:broad specificity phosphatase PhoE